MKMKNKQLQKVYDNFALGTNKLNENYYRELRYRQLTNLLHESLYHGLYVDKLKSMIKYIESFTVSDLNTLCDLADIGKLDDLVIIIKQIIKTPT